MKKLWKFAFAVLLVVLVVAALALVACNPNDNPQLPQTPDGGGTGTGSDAKTTYTVTFDANGGRFADNAEKQTNQVESGSKLTAPVSPERTNYTFAGWSKNKNGSDMWKFDTDTVTANTTLYAKWTQTSAVVLSVDGASMDGATIFMFVEHDVDSVPLTDKVVCSDDSTWKLYYDKMGQQPIPTKVAAQMNGFLSKGANVFYILVSSQNGTQENLYELTVYRSYEVPVCYYNGDHLIYTDSCYTGHEYVANYQPNIEGYTFNYWTNGGSQYKTETIWGELNLVANKTANKYDVTFAVNQGNALSEQDQSKTVTYDSAFKLPVPTRTGYSFVGWYSGSTQITAGNGNGLLPWNIADDVQLQAHWQANEYELTVRASNAKAGTVSGTGTYAYDSSVKLTAETNSGYTFVGWFDGDDKISDQLTFNYTMGLAKTITAKWSKVTLTVNNSSAGSVQQLTEKYKVGDEVQITAVTKPGYTFVGWYKEDQQISTDLQCTITMTDSDVTYTAKWSKVTLTVNNSSAGSVQQLTEKYKVGEEVQITAVTKPGYTFVGWYKEDQQISTDLQCTITMTDSDVTYTAKWSKVTLTVNNSSAGSVQQLTEKYKVDDEVQITAVTKPGYTFVGWYKEDQQISTDLQCTITMTDSDITYTAQWSKVTLTVNDSSAGSVQQLTEKYKVGDEVQIAAVTKPGYTFVGWYKEDQQISTDLQCTITMTDSDVTYTAKWEPILYNLTFNYDSKIGDFDGDKPTKYTIEGLTLPQLVGKNGNGHFGIEWRDEAGKIYTNEIPQGTTGDLTLTLTKWVGIHTWGSDGKCIYCQALKEPYSEVDGEVKPYTMSDGKIVFGTYPQSKVEDTALQSMLNAEIQNKLPSSKNANGWTDYGYYISGEVQSYMWYVDVEYQGAKYRGVYFTSYRLEYTTSSSGSTYQDNNGYKTNTVYWFKWEPITWRILSQDDSKMFIMADLIIDSQQYYHKSSGTRIIDGKIVYPNNYKESDIRKWLNFNFYNFAFDEMSKNYIIQTEVDNSASTTGDSSNEYVCENTNDNIFLLSYNEVTNSSYGLNSSTRQLKTTDYAQCQGVLTATSVYQGCGYWWLRSPYYDYGSYDARYVHLDGSVYYYYCSVHYTYRGVVPALNITL